MQYPWESCLTVSSRISVQENALKAVSVLLAIAPLAKNAKGSVLFPARMHMLFKGISGVYACANANCSRSHSEGGLTLGEVYLSDGNLTCPHCGSVVYELYNDQTLRCAVLQRAMSLKMTRGFMEMYICGIIPVN